jgi:hypothetical protein
LLKLLSRAEVKFKESRYNAARRVRGILTALCVKSRSAIRLLSGVLCRPRFYRVDKNLRFDGFYSIFELFYITRSPPVRFSRGARQSGLPVAIEYTDSA